VGHPGVPESTDAELVAAAREGDERAFERLLVRHEARVLRVLRLLGVPSQDREDVAQEVFIRVFRHLAGFRPGFAFEGWIYRITVNAAHDHRANSSRRLRGHAEWEAESRAPRVASGGEAGELAVRVDRRRELERALVGLTERERAVFVLCELEGLETRRVALALGITSITVRRHLGRARKRLTRVLSGGRDFQGAGKPSES
jgi:RNA polymerase sigma-70 factor (ECF subfamily)